MVISFLWITDVYITGYCSDMTRTIMIGKADKKQKEIYNTVLNAQMTGLNVLKQELEVFLLIKPQEML